jgi:hypothetical protein
MKHRRDFYWMASQGFGKKSLLFDLKFYSRLSLNELREI